VSNENAAGAVSPESQASSVGQTGNVGSSTSVASGAAKVFKEFKWGLLTLFLLMVVVIGLVYDGGRKKKLAEADQAKSAPTPDVNLDAGTDSTPPPTTVPTGVADSTPLPPPPAHSSAPEIDTSVATPPPPPTAPAAPAAPSSPGLGEAHPAPKASKPETTHAAPAPHEEPKTSAPAAPGSEKTYVVQSGDTLTKIANSQMSGKASVKALLAANKDVLSDPNKLKAGMKLKIPVLASDEVKESKGTAAVKPTNAVKPAEKEKKSEDTKKADSTPKPEAEEYTVQAGDTLEKIARKVLNDGRKWKELYEWNRDQLPDPGRLRVGQVLKIKEAAALKAASSTQPKTHAEAELPKDESAPVKVVTHESGEKSHSKTTESKTEKAVAVQHDEVQACSTSAFAP
jgi:nucleoid-associated protein YgaU